MTLVIMQEDILYMTDLTFHLDNNSEPFHGAQPGDTYSQTLAKKDYHWSAGVRSKAPDNDAHEP